MDKNDGMNYAPQGKPNRVVEPGEFRFAAVALDHGHIYGMCNGLVEAGAELTAVYDPDPNKVQAFIAKFPQARAAASEEEILSDPSILLVASAAVPSERGPLGLRVMEHGKDYFTDKAPFTALEQLEAARDKVKMTGRKYMVYYSERLHVECAVFAGQLIEQGAIGRVVQVIGTGPHRLNAPSRPEWFFSSLRNTAEFFAISEAIRSSNSCITPVPKTRPSRTAKWLTITARIIKSCRISAMPR